MTTAPVITRIPIEQLHPSPFNPRRTFNEAGLEELATTIARDGILQPLLVRPILANILRPDEHAGYELIFGHRRLRAAEIAGLQELPCEVRAMDDATARRLQLVENLARQDVHPIEEAEGFRALMEAHGLSADQLTEQTGKSRSYVYGRLKLLQAVPEVREACLRGEVGSEVALLVARLRHPKLQAKALAAIKGKYLHLDEGGATSFRRIRALLLEEFTLDIAARNPTHRPIFDPEDTTLVPDAGACSVCPKLSGNAPEYTDAVEHGTSYYREEQGRGCATLCTDPDCYQAKKTAHLAREAAALQAEGATVITGNKARAAVSAHGELKAGYVPPSAAKAVIAEAKKAGKVIPIVKVQDPRTGKVHQAVRVADVPGLAEKLEAKGGQQNRGRQQQLAHLAERDAQDTAERIRRRALFQAVAGVAMKKPRDVLELRVIAEVFDHEINHPDATSLVLETMGLPPDSFLDADRLTPDQLGTFMLLLAVASAPLTDSRCTGLRPSDTVDLNRLAEHYGIDPSMPVQASAPAEGASTPPPAARAAKGARKAPAARGPAVAGTEVVPASAWPFPRPPGAGAPDGQTDDAGCAGGSGVTGVERDPRVPDMFDNATADAAAHA